MATRIESVRLEAFRGATAPVNIEFDTSKPIALIFGENGSGKSTIVDAIDFVCNEKYGSLSDRSSANPKTHLHSFGRAPNDLTVTVTAAGKTWTGRLQAQGPRASGPADRPAATILRRSQILRVVTAQPKQRYEVLQQFIELPGVQRSEESLRAAAKLVSEGYDRAALAKQQADESLQRLWRDEGCPDFNAFSWAKNKTSEDPAALQVVVSVCGAFCDAAGNAATSRTKLDTTLQQYASAEESVRVAEEALRRAEKQGEQENRSMVDLLESVERYLREREPPTSCPVCGSAERAADLNARVAARLFELKELVSLKRAVDTAKAAVGESAAVLARAREAFTSAVRELGLLIQQSTIPVVVSFFSPIDCGSYPTLLGTDKVAAVRDGADQAEALWNAVKGCQEAVAARRDDTQKTLNQLNAIKGHVATVEEKTSEAIRFQALKRRLDSLLAIVASKRKAYVQSVLVGIAGAVEGMYAKAHPGEGIGKIRFFLKPNVIGSLEFDGEFQNKPGQPPQAYYSDSHLDTLGVCVFLALAKHFMSEDSVVVLDDVVTSADSVHMERLISMIHDEARNFNQLILTTHYRPWRERYRYGAFGQVQLVELAPWSFSRGVWPAKTKLSIDELRDLLATPSFDRQSAASKAGIFLESLLDFIALRYGCRVPRQVDPNFTLGVLASAIDSKLSKLLKIEQTPAGSTMPSGSIPLRLLISEATQWMWVRNQVGCHFSVPGMDVPDADVRLFAEKTVALGETLMCAACGELPAHNKSGSYWECRCGVVRMFPLVQPGASVGSSGAV